MIRKVADILHALIAKESKKLEEFDIKHAPTIGDMYEGLSAKILEKSIPEDLDLKITNGFIFDGSNTQTGQIDCMLVKGEGIKIPYTQSYKWHIKDVIAVFEIKKNLYSKELIDSFFHLREVSHSYSRYLFDDENTSEQEFEISRAYNTFSKLTGIYAPEFHERNQLSEGNQLIYHTLITELLSPIRIVLGYSGFKSEFSLREAFVDFIEQQGIKQGFGIPSFPHLITCMNHSLVKMNGYPYIAPFENEEWDFYTSTSENPLLVLLELIWTKLSYVYKVGMPWGDDLETERFNKFMSAKAVTESNRKGWFYRYTKLSNKSLKVDSKRRLWEPVELNSAQFTIINNLCADVDEYIDNKDFIKFVEESGFTVKDFVDDLLKTGLIALDGCEIKLITKNCQCVITPDGKLYATDDVDGRLTLWITEKITNSKT